MATPFAALSVFPFCPSDISAWAAANQFDYAGNLTLATVMAFYWNLSSIDLLTGGTITSYAGTPDEATLSALSTTTPYAQFAEPWTNGSADGAWTGSVTSRTFTTFPNFTQPRERVCVGGASPSSGYFQTFSSSITALGQVFDFTVAIGTDPSNAGKYRLYYKFLFDPCEDDGVSENARAAFVNPAQNATDTIASGTNTIGGIAFDWEATTYSDPAYSSSSGLAMVLNMGSHTYP